MLSDDSDDSDTSLSKKSAISSVEISESPARNEQILPNFYFSVPWRIFIRIVELADSSVEVRISRVTLYRDAQSVRPSCQRNIVLSCIRLV